MEELQLILEFLPFVSAIVVVSVGGFLGMGDRNVAVQPGSVVLNEQTDGSARMVINTTKEDLKNAPAFNFADVDKAGAGAATTGQADKTPPQPYVAFPK